MNEEAIADKKGPGRPKSQSNPVLKKGRSSWKPASVTDVTNKEPGYRYRWVNKLADNLAKKAQEGWETISGITADGSQVTDDGKMNSGKKLTSIYEKHDVILQRMPEELAQERDAYYEDRTKKQTLGLTSHFKSEVKKEGAAPTHGEITISSLRDTQVIK